RRSLQGHGRPGGQPADQDHQHRGAAGRALDGVSVTKALFGRAAAAALFVFCAVGQAQTGKTFIVAAAHPLAVDAGYDVLKRGGPAVDAAIAVQMVLGLAEPVASGIGGGAFMLHWSGSERTLRAYDGRETAPAAADSRLFLDSKDQPLE